MKEEEEENCEEKGVGGRGLDGRVREDPCERHADDRSPVVRSNLTQCPDPGSDTSQYGTRARNGPTLPFASNPQLLYIVVTLLLFPPRIFPFVLISLPLSILLPSSLISQLQEEVMSPN